MTLAPPQQQQDAVLSSDYLLEGVLSHCVDPLLPTSCALVCRTWRDAVTRIRENRRHQTIAAFTTHYHACTAARAHLIESHESTKLDQQLTQLLLPCLSSGCMDHKTLREADVLLDAGAIPSGIEDHELLTANFGVFLGSE